MPYKPTGRPPGRPKNPAPKAEAKPEVPAVSRQTHPYLGPIGCVICPSCYPDGWPMGATGLSCPHGVWTRRL